VTFYFLNMKNEMAKPLGLAPRGGSYQLRITVPQELRHLYGGSKDIRVTLGRLNWAQAKVASTRVRAEKELEFAGHLAAMIKMKARRTN
jgi:hypothetical protein